MWRRLKNLLELSRYRPKTEEYTLANGVKLKVQTGLELDIKPKPKLATIIEDDLPDMFEEQKDL